MLESVKELNEYLNMFLIFTLAWFLIFLVTKALKSERWGLKSGPFYLIYRTKIFNNALKVMSRKKRFWKTVWNLGVIAGMGQLAFITYMLLRNLILLSTQPMQAAQLTVLVPGITVSGPSIPYLLITFFILIITHEAAHGIASLVEGIPIKSSGMFLAAVVPGGFVEIDEKKLEKADELKKLRVFAAGSFSNIMFGIFAIILVMNFPGTLSPICDTTSNGVLITGVLEEGPAVNAGIKKWDIIYSLDQVKIGDMNALREYMNRVSPNSPITVTTNRGSYTLTTKPDPFNASRALIGILPFNFYPPKFNFLPTSTAYHIFMVEYWANIVLISVALINMLPIYPLDGGRYLYSIMKILKVRRRNQIKNFVSILFILILVLNLLLSFTNFGLRKL